MSSSPQKVLSSGLTTLSESFIFNMLSRLPGVCTSDNRPPIHTLPEELLIAVFKLAVELFPYHEDYEDIVAGSSRFHTFSLVQLTHVCKRWRDVALAYPCFWSYIDDIIYDHAQIFLERSGAASLWLRMQTGTDGAKQTLASGGERITRLDLEVSMSDIDELALLDFPPISLQCLTVSYDYYLDLREPYSYPIVLFHQEDLPLKALAINGGHRWLPSNHFPQLTHLHIELVPERGFPIFELYSLLARTPQLQYLFIRCIPLHQGSVSAAWPTTHLPQMRFLSLSHGYFESSAKFIANLAIPPTALIQLDSMIIFDSPCPQLNHLAPMSTLRTLEIAIDEGYVHLMAHGKEGAFWLQGVIEADPSFPSRGRWLGSLRAMLPVSQIEILRLYVGDRPSHFFSILRQMPRVQILKVHFDRQHEEQYAHPGSSFVRSLYTILALSPVCPNLMILAVDVAGEGHKALPNLHIDALTRALSARGAKKLMVRIQPLADRSCVEQSSPDDVLARIVVQTRVPVYDIVIYRPGRPIAPFREEIWWRPAEAFEYWDSMGEFEPSYQLPWDREHAH